MNIMSHQSKLTQENINEIIRLYESGLSIRKIEPLCNVKRTMIGTILKTNNIKTKSCGNAYRLRKYKLNEHYFNKIDNENKAYWLGFIIADGHVSDDGLILRLCIKDENHLKKFLKDIESDTLIKYDIKTKSCNISLYSYDLVKSLRKLKLSKNKSKDAIFPSVKKSLLKHLMRGMVDGDGSISITKNKYKKGVHPIFAIKMCGTKDIVTKFHDNIINKLKLNNHKISCTDNGFCQVEWGGNKLTIKILSWFYKDANVYLERKYKRYIQLKEIQ